MKNVLLISVGGSPEPIVTALKERKPDGVIFFSSKGSRTQVEDQILPNLGYFPRCGHIVTPDHENVGTCVFELIKKVPEEMIKLGSDDVWPSFCGYTGGTKAMSAAVVWAASRFPCELIYVGGTVRNKDGLGIVEEGYEKLVCIENPWNKIGWFETRTAFELFNRAQYVNAADVLRDITTRMSSCDVKIALSYFMDVFDAIAAWDAFQHTKALKFFEQAVRKLPEIKSLMISQFPESELFLNWLEQARDHLRGLKIFKDGSLPITQTLIDDLLANALRRARLEGKFEDATARLYALFEKEVKRRLQEKHNIDNSKCSIDSIPELMRTEYVKYLDEESHTCKFGLKASFYLLNALGEDDVTKRYLEKEQAISFALGKRNKSILGHGSESITEKEFDELLELVLFVLNKTEDQILKIPQIN